MEQLAKNGVLNLRGLNGAFVKSPGCGNEKSARIHKMFNQ